MAQEKLKDKISTLFNSRTGITVKSGVKGSSVGIQILSFAMKAGLVAAGTPIGMVAVVGGSALVAGGIVAYDKFRTAVKKAAEKENSPLLLALNQPKRLSCSLS